MSNSRWYRSRSLFAAPQRLKPPRRKSRILRIASTAVRRTCTLIGAFVLLGALFGALLPGRVMKQAALPALPDEMVLYFPVEDTLVEHEDTTSPYSFTEKALTIRNVVNALDYAAGDKRVRGMVAKLAGGSLELSHIEELRNAIARFRASGKFAYIYAPSYESLGEYYFASAFEEVWMQPVGVVSIPGINLEVPFAREALDKIGVEPQVFSRKEYKSIFESFTDKEMSPASREAVAALVGSIAKSIMTGVEADRGFESGELQRLIDKGLFTDSEALDVKLVDRLNYIDEFNAHIKQIVKGDPENEEELFTPVSVYLRDKKSAPGFEAAAAKKPKVALVYAVGQIMQHDDSGVNLSAADRLTKSIGQAVDDDRIDVIVMRIDSPGGDPSAAEAIRRSIIKAQEKGKQIIVSMGGAAASGGYWIAAPADYIFALETTLTGSIGVAGGKFSLLGMWGKLGVNWDGVRWGKNAGLWSFNEPYSPSEAARMNALMDSVYEDFINLVAEGRGMSPEQADRVAGGRVWTGAQAKDAGLVDAIGGLDGALDYAAGLEGKTDRREIDVIIMPRPRTLFEKAIDLLEMQAAMGSFFSANRDILAVLVAQVRKLAVDSTGLVTVDSVF